MPELPEVETCIRSLVPHVVGRKIAAFWHSGLALRHPLDLKALAKLRGQPVLAIERVGKYLLFHFAGRKKTGALTMIGHLGMSGAFFVVDKNAPLLPHTHLRFLLARPQGELRYVDPRRFGSLRVVKNSEVAETLDLGPDPFSAAFTPTDFHAALLASQQTLKTLLLDQHTVAGLGNIYVAEALFLAGLSPQRRGHAVSAKEAHRLHGVIVSVLSEAIARRGTTLSDGGYVDAEGKEGENQHHLFVYDRGGAPCRQCQTPIERIVQAQRSTYFCPHCQT